MSMKNSKLLKMNEVSERLRVPLMTCYSWVRSGMLPHFRLGKTIRISEGDLEAFLEQRRRGTRTDILA